MLSPANTAVCLTTTAGSCSSTEPDQYYPSGERNYARVVAHDAFQGAAVAEFMQTKGVKSLYILNDKETYGLGIAQNLRDSAESLGINIAGFEAWDPKASSYEALFQKIGQTDADAVFLGGLIDENGAQVIKDKVAVLGPNNGKVALYAPDGFATQATIDEAGSAAQDMWMSVAGTPIDAYSGTAQEFVTGFTDQYLDANTPIDPYAIFGAQAAVVMLDAIAASDGSRADIITQMFDTSISDGYLGSFSFNENGDPQDASGTIVQFTIYRANYEARDRDHDLASAVDRRRCAAAFVGRRHDEYRLEAEPQENDDRGRAMPSLGVCAAIYSRGGTHYSRPPCPPLRAPT